MSFAPAANLGRSSRAAANMTKVFLAAFAIRATYALLLYSFMGDDGLESVDSITYAYYGQTFADAITTGSLRGSHWLGDFAYNMPFFQWLTALPFLLFGKAGTIGYVLLQGAFDSGTCALVYWLARLFDPGLAWPSAACAILNPTQIVLSGLIYTDTPFTFFVTLTFCLAARWIARPSLTNAICLGCSLGAAALIRVTIAPWGFCAIGLLAVFALWRGRSFWQASGLTAAAAILCASLAIIAARNLDQYGTFALTPQGGDYLAIWVVPLAKEAQDRTPFTTSADEMTRRSAERFGPPSANPFEQSKRYQQIGWEALRNEIRWQSLVASWASGIFINLTSPAHLLSPPVSQLPRTGFYATPGRSFAEKVYNYAFRSGNVLYSWLLILGSLGIVAIRLVQLVGLCALMKQKAHWSKLLFAGSWIAFLLLLNGPIASPKYRLPLEPLFNILAGAGIRSILIFRQRKQRGFENSPAETQSGAMSSVQTSSQ
jgi:4-amino-4-deoxy-L-arabinose transferase-like glycosyltransferase